MNQRANATPALLPIACTAFQLKYANNAKLHPSYSTTSALANVPQALIRTPLSLTTVRLTYNASPATPPASPAVGKIKIDAPAVTTPVDCTASSSMGHVLRPALHSNMLSTLAISYASIVESTVSPARTTSTPSNATHANVDTLCTIKSAFTNVLLATTLHLAINANVSLFFTFSLLISCLACSFTCATCSSASHCLSCGPNFELLNGKCLQNCPAGTYTSEGHCKGRLDSNKQS